MKDLLRLLLMAIVCLLVSPAMAQTFPPLTGRVVDEAQLLQPEQKAAIEAKLERIEQATGHQVVVATVPDLQGYPIEDYGYRLGRAWQIGDKEKNDGVVLLIAKNDRKLRIEVGYGLEPQLTDAWSSLIINNTITPRFKDGDFPGGIEAGVDAIGEQIGLTPEEAAKRTAAMAAGDRKRSANGDITAAIVWIVIFFVIITSISGALSRGNRRRHRSGLGEAILWTAVNAAINSRNDDDWGGGGGFGGGGGWGGGSGGGFSGGGGSFGGGGASGGW